MIRKICVEECIRLQASIFGRMIPSAGSLTWKRKGEIIGQINYSRKRFDLITLRYTLAGKSYEYDIELNTTPLPWDRVRTWFTCPHCDRRVAHLYLPNGAEQFSCRHCYHLTYRSSQNNSRWSRLFTMQD